MSFDNDDYCDDCDDDYSKSPKNKYNLSNKQICKYYRIYEKMIVGNDVGYLQHVPKTNKEMLNPNFLRDSIVKCANKYVKKYIIPHLTPQLPKLPNCPNYPNCSNCPTAQTAQTAQTVQFKIEYIYTRTFR